MIFKVCPACGKSNSIIKRDDLSTSFKIDKKTTFIVENITGLFCKNCKESFFDKKALRYINKSYYDYLADYNKDKIKANELISIGEFANKIGKTRRKTLQLLKNGYLKYINIDGDIRLILKSEIDRFTKRIINF